MNGIENQAPASIGPRALSVCLANGGAVQLLDVRTPGEYAAGHVPGARLVPLGDLNPAEIQRDGKSGAIYILCQSGQRARKAIAKLESAGVRGCILVEGGTQAWIDAGLPIERGPGGGLSLMRQVQIMVGLVSALGAGLALSVNSYFALVPLVMGCGLLLAGITGTCGLALVLAKMPWNRVKDCGASCTGHSGEAL